MRSRALLSSSVFMAVLYSKWGTVAKRINATGEGATMPQRVLITAGAAGIGREFARAFAATGSSVFVCDIDTKALEAIAQDIPGLIARPCDMSRRADVERMVPDAVEKLGGLDVLINNAGISGMTLPVVDYPPDDWDKAGGGH